MNNLSNRPLRTIVIVHGISERILVQMLRRILRSNLKIIGHKNGRSSIQIHKELPRIIRNKLRGPEYIKKKYRPIDIKNLKIFTIMDLDDVEDISVKKNYINGHISGIINDKKFFNKHLQPIYCNSNLEDVLRPTLKGDTPHNSKEKGHYRDKLNKIIYDMDSINDFSKILSNQNNTNLNTFLDFLLQNAAS